MNMKEYGPMRRGPLPYRQQIDVDPPTPRFHVLRGELAAQGPTAAAIANAVAGTGTRLRDMTLRLAP
jgi:hypothetical protein